MIVGVPKEIKPQENRVALTPAGAHALCQKGHRVLVQCGAGRRSGFDDDGYAAAGAELIPKPGELFREAGRVRKFTEPPGDRTRLARLARGTPEPVRSAKGNREMPAQSPRISAT